jgi:hypothetical protein
MRAVICVFVGVVAGAGALSAQAAPRVTGLEFAYGVSTPAQANAPVKHVSAQCRPGKVVVGGGAFARSSDGTIPIREVVLTELRPTQTAPYPGTGRLYAYRASAAETYVGWGSPWQLHVHAVCADPIPGHEIVNSPLTDPASDPMQSTLVRCPAGKFVLGSGASVYFGAQPYSEQGIGLQVARTASGGDLVRAQAHEAPENYQYNWQLRAHAICGEAPQGYEIRWGGSPEQVPGGVKTAYASCREHQQALGLGGAVSNVAPGYSALLGLTAGNAAGIVNARDYTDSIAAALVCVDL